MRIYVTLALASLGLASGCRNFDPPSGSAESGSCCQGTGSCVPDSLVPSELASRLGQDECDEALLCAPSAWLENFNARPARCRSGGEREGRCLPSCLPDVAGQSERLSRDECGKGELCVPCFDPLSGEDSLACRIGGDAPREKARPFQTCCEGQGHCIPERALLMSLPLEARARLGNEGCDEDESALCVPQGFLTGAEAQFDECRIAGDLEGRCLPSCLPLVAEQLETLQQRDCDRAERCVPCFDPRTGEDTGACRTGDDKPREPARSYERCCGAPGSQLGTCLPLELLPPEQVDALPTDSCRHAGTRCVPDELLSGSGEFTQCAASLLGVAPIHGVCLPECFIPLAARLLTPRGTCGAPRRCVPCTSLNPGQPGCE